MDPQGSDQFEVLNDPSAARAADAPAAQEPGGLPPGRTRMRLAIAMVALAFVGTVGVLCYRSWLYAPANPASVVIVQGDEPYRGALVRIESPAGAFEGTIQPETKYVCSFHLPPGRYMLRVSLAGATVEEGIVNVGEHQYRVLTLTRLRKKENAAPAASAS